MKYKGCFFIWALACCAASAAVVHVAPTGSDQATGTSGAPLATLEAARDNIRALRAAGSHEAMTILLADGTYRLPACVVFEAKDAGTAQQPLTIRAAHRGKARLTGGIPLPPSSLLTDNTLLAQWPPEAKGHVRVVPLRAAGITAYGVVRAAGVGGPGEGMQLVWNGAFQTLARWPNDGYTGIASVPDMGKDATGRRRRAPGFVYADERPSRWVNEIDPYGNGFFCYNWAAANVAFASIDPVTKTIRHQGGGSGYGYSRNGFWFGYNLLCELDAPGEYYIDRQAGNLYFWPSPERATEASELTMTETLLSFQHLSHATLDGLVLENCRHVALAVRGGGNLNVRGCVFRNIGSRAIEIVNARQIRVAGCDIARCMAGGITIHAGDKKTLTHGEVVIDNNHIHHYALGTLTYAPAVRFSGCGITVTRNTIHDAPHTAILFNGRENRIAFNEIHSVCLDAGEMGAIYSGRDWTTCGNEIDANFFHDIYNPRSQRNRAIMLDDGCAGIAMRSNVIVRVAEGISLSAIGNVIEANLFVSNFPAVSCWQKWEHAGDYTNTRYTHKQLLDLLAEIPVHEEPWKSKYPYLGMIDDAIKTGRLRDPATRTVVRGNAAWHGDPEWIRFMGKKYAYSPQTWLVEKNTVGVPRPLPPAERFGVYPSPERVTWPIAHPVTITCTNLTTKRDGR